MLSESATADIVDTNEFTSSYGNQLRNSLVTARLGPARLPPSNLMVMEFDNGRMARRHHWGGGTVKAALPPLEPIARVGHGKLLALPSATTEA